MAKKKRPKKQSEVLKADEGYGDILSEVVELLESARHLSARAVNSIMTATYWEIGRRIVELEQGGEGRAKYGQQLIPQLASDLTERFGRGFSKRNLEQMRLFYQHWPIAQTVSAQSKSEAIPQTASDESDPTKILQTLSAKFQQPPSEGLATISGTRTPRHRRRAEGVGF